MKRIIKEYCEQLYNQSFDRLNGPIPLKIQTENLIKFYFINKCFIL